MDQRGVIVIALVTGTVSGSEVHLGALPVSRLRPPVLQLEQLVPPHGLGHGHRVGEACWTPTFQLQTGEEFT